MFDYNYKINNFILPSIKNIKNPKILEFGVKEGRSTKLFLDLCELNDGELISVDIDDYSNLYDNKKWTFLKSRDDDFKFIDKYLSKDLDVIYLDSLHTAEHVKKIFYHYFKFLKIEGFFFIDDISWLPYLKNKKRNNFYCEINNKETFEKILDIYNNNEDNLDISFSFLSSGSCKIIKKSEKLNDIKIVKTRELSLKNKIRKFFL